MIEKNINSRIQHKHDIEANWEKALNFIPKAGEIIIYDIDENNSAPRVKIGDGETNVNELPFITSGSSWDDIEDKPFETISDIIFDGIVLKDTITGMDYIITIQNGNLVSSLKCSGIEIITMPNKTEYMTGESFDFTGIVAIAHYPDGSTREITDELYTTDRIVEGMTSVKINYTEFNTTHVANVNITVRPFDAANILVDFDYVDNGDGTYTITGWKQTLNGEPSTEMIVPDYPVIII